MKHTAHLFFTALLLGSLAFTVQGHAADQPCAEALKQYRSLKTTANTSQDTLKKADLLEAKAVKRCQAHDDKRAGQFIAEATKLLGK